MTDQNNETTEIDVYRPHLAELTWGSGDSSMIRGQISITLKEAIQQKKILLLDECHTLRDGMRPRDWTAQSVDSFFEEKDVNDD